MVKSKRSITTDIVDTLIDDERHTYFSLSTKLGVSVKTVRRSIKYLRSVGHIIESKRHYIGSQYFVTLKWKGHIDKEFDKEDF